MKKLLFAAILLAALAGCRKPVFFEHRAIQTAGWDSSQAVPFQVKIPTAGTYAISFHIRFTEAYPWSNIWLRAEVDDAKNGKLFSQQINIPLTDADGRPLQGMTGGYADRMFPSPKLEQRKLPITFTSPGEYTIRLSQEMRSATLSGIAFVGLELERID